MGDCKEWQCAYETDKAVEDRLVRPNSSNNLQLRSISPAKSPIFDFLDEDALAAIEAKADWLLSEKGIVFRDNPAAC